MRKAKNKIQNESLAKRSRRKLSIRKKVSGTAERPRVCVNKTNEHLFVQVVDDVAGKTLFAVKTFGKNAPATSKNKDGAKLLGTTVGEKLKTLKIASALFDRNGYKYTGVVAALADSIREAGIQV